MFDRLLEFANELTREDLSALCLQDVALCAAWYQSGEGDETVLRPYERIPRNVGEWTATVTARQLTTEGRRHQWLLRDKIDALQAGALPGMERDEIDFLSAVHALGRRVADPQLFRRVLLLLHPYVSGLQARQQTLPVLPGLPNIAQAFHVINAVDIERSRPRQVGSVAGIAMPGRGPVLGMRGHVKVLGDVPDNATLVVEEGSCSVEGFVLGRLAVLNDCDVRENICGAVISRQGDIRARNIVDHATVVAKAGSVQIRGCFGPELLYAGVSIRVGTCAARGHYIAPDIWVKDEVRGGRLEITRRLVAGCLAADEDGPPVEVVLRKHLSPEDYGERCTEAVKHIMRRARRISEEIGEFGLLRAAAEREAERCAQTALLRLVGDSRAAGVLAAFEEAAATTAAIDRLHAVLSMLRTLTDDCVAHLPESRAPDSESQAGVLHAACAIVKAECIGILETRPVPAPVLRIAADAKKICDRLGTAARKPSMLSTLLDAVRTAMVGVQRLRREWGGRAAMLEIQASRSANLDGVVREAGGMRSYRQVLAQVLQSLRTAPRDTPLAQRAETPFVQAMLRNTARHQQRITRYLDEITLRREQFQRIRDELSLGFRIGVSLDERGPRPGAMVTARFGGGVYLHADAYCADTARRSAGTVFAPPHTGQHTKTYVNDVGEVVELDPAHPQASAD